MSGGLTPPRATRCNAPTSRLRRLVSRVRAVVTHARHDVEARREIAAHLQLLDDEYRRRGLPPGEAARAARLALGGVEQTLEQHREARSLGWLEDLTHDAAHAWRGLRRTPLFAAAAIGTLALGIGATTAVFTVVEALLVKPLPYASAGARPLVRLIAHTPSPPGSTAPPRRGDVGFTNAELQQLARSTYAFSAMTTVGSSVLLLPGLDTGHVTVGVVTPELLPLLGATPLLGRAFDTTDLTGSADVALVSHRAWQRYFSGDPAVLGRPLTFETVLGRRTSRTLTVVGVMPPSFAFPTDDTAFWVLPSAATGGAVFRGRLLARLAPGVGIGAALAEITPTVRAIRAHPDGIRYELVREQDEIVGPVRPAVLVLAAAAAVLMLIACLNVANLLLARTLARERELALRAAVGASRGRLVRQCLTESALLASLGGAAGIAIAVGLVRGFRRLATTLPRIDLTSSGPGWGGAAFPRLQEISLDATVLAFALSLTGITVFAIGLGAALRAAGTDVFGAFRTGVSSTSARGAVRIRQLLVVAQIAGAMALLVGAVLLTRSLQQLLSNDTGFRAERVVTFQVSLPSTRYPDQRLRAFAETLVDRLRGRPDIDAAAYANQVPFVGLRDTAGGLWTTADATRAFAPDAADARFVSRDYLAALGVRVVEGRGLTAADGEGQPRVLLVNEALVRIQFAGRSPVGRQVFLGRDVHPWTIVGVVGDVRQFGLDRPAEPQFFADLRQWSGGLPLFPVGAYFVVKTSVAAESLARDLRTAAAALDPEAAVFNVAPLTAIVAASVARPRLYATLVGGFAVLGVGLAAIGVYGVLAFLVQARTTEFGIRLALGASTRQLLGLVLGQGAALVASGLALGAVTAFGLSRLLAGVLVGVTPGDPAAFAIAAALFVAIGAVASVLPARHATRVDPLSAIRCE